MGSEERPKGKMSAWLQKKKSGTSMVRVRQYNKRYFTIDFDEKTFFYTYAENGHKVGKGSIIHFAEIIDVRLLEPQTVKGDTVSECSKTSRVSWMKRLGSGARLGVEEEHCVTVQTRKMPDKAIKMIELACSSAAEALQWFEAFKIAIEDGGEGGGAATGNAACGEGGPDSPSSGEAPPKDIGAKATKAAALMGPPPSTNAAPVPAAPVHAAPVPAAPVHAAPVGSAEPGNEAAPAPPLKGTFLDLNMESQEPLKEPVQGAVADDIAVLNLNPDKLQATAFGFDGEEDSGSSSASSPVGTPCKGDNAVGLGLDLAGVPEDRTMQPFSQPATGRRSYADQHEGLSMKERLASLEFSDAEDDDDDILGLKGKAG